MELDALDKAARKRAARRELAVAGLLASAASLVSAGCWLLAPACGLIVAGICLAVLTIVIFGDIT